MYCSVALALRSIGKDFAINRLHRLLRFSIPKTGNNGHLGRRRRQGVLTEYAAIKHIKKIFSCFSSRVIGAGQLVDGIHQDFGVFRIGMLVDAVA